LAVLLGGALAGGACSSSNGTPTGNGGRGGTSAGTAGTTGSAGTTGGGGTGGSGGTGGGAAGTTGGSGGSGGTTGGGGTGGATGGSGGGTGGTGGGTVDPCAGMTAQQCNDMLINKATTGGITPAAPRIPNGTSGSPIAYPACQ
jgi:hypothetical protein